MSRVVHAVRASAATCESLTSLAVPHGTVTLAQTVAPGAFTPPAGARAGRGGQNPFAKLGSFCRVAVTLKPGAAVRHQGGSLAAVVRLERQAAGRWQRRIRRHDQLSGDGQRARGWLRGRQHRHRTHRAVDQHVRERRRADRLRASRDSRDDGRPRRRRCNGFFGNAPKLSYFNGCSTGGRQAVTAAQRYPEDFDGIVGGAPASHTSTQAFGQIWFAQALADPASALPREKLDAAARRGAQRVRRARRREGRRARESARLQVRSAGAGVQAGSDSCVLPHAGAGGRRADGSMRVLRIRERVITSSLGSSGERAGLESGAGRLRRGLLQVHRLQGSQLGSEDAELRLRRRAREQGRQS